MKSVKIFSAVLLIAIIALTACAQSAKTLATVNGQPITERDLNTRLNIYGLVYRHGFDNEQAKATIVKQMVEEALLLQEASRRKVKPEAKAIDDEKARFKDFLLFQVGQGAEGAAPHGAGGPKISDPSQNEAKLKEETAKKNLTQKELDQFVVDLMTIQLLYDEITGKVTASDEEARDFYNKNQDKFKTPEQVKASHILVKTEEEAKKVLAEVKAAPDKFGELAKKYSTDPGSKDNGGDLGFFGRGQMVEPFEKTAFTLNPGQISDAVKSDFGFHIIKVAEKKPAVQTEFEKAKEQARQAVIDTKQKAEFDNLMAKLKTEGKITPPEVLQNKG